MNRRRHPRQVHPPASGRDPPGVHPLAAQSGAQRQQAQGPQHQAVLGRDPDGARDLMRVGVDQIGALAGVGGRRCGQELVVVVPGGPTGQLLAGFGADISLGQLVLDGLKGTDRPAELMALGDVLHRL